MGSVSPLTAILNQPQIFTISGSNLPSTLAFTVYGSDANDPCAAQAGATTTRVQWRCIPKTSGNMTYLVKDQPNGSLLDGNSQGTVVVTDPTPIVSLVSPSSGATGIDPKSATLSWNASGQTSSHAVVSKNSSFTGFSETNNVCTDSTTCAECTTSSATSCTLNNLAYGTLYYWHVRANNSTYNMASAWTGYRTFTTLAPAAPTVTLYSPANGATNIDPTSAVFTWNSTNATAHRLLINTSQSENGYDDAAKTCASNTCFTCATGSNKSSSYCSASSPVTLSQYLKTGTRYYWKVKVADQDVNTPDVWSNYSSFTTSAPVNVPNITNVISNPASPVVGQAITFTATTDIAASSVQFQFDGGSKQQMTGSNGGTTWTYIRSEGLADTVRKTYYLYVNGSSTVAKTGTIQAISPTIPTILQPTVVNSGDSSAPYKFSVTLSGALPANHYIAINFDNLRGEWFQQSDDGGHFRLDKVSDTLYSKNRVLNYPGIRYFRAGIFDSNDVQVGDYSSTGTCTLDSCLAAVLDASSKLTASIVGNPSLSRSGSQLLRGVDVANGNYHLYASDISVSSKGPDFVVIRAYNSLTGAWTFNLDAKITITNDNLVAIGPREDGRTQYFYRNMDDKLWYTITPGNFDQLIQETDGSFTLYTQGNLYYRFAPPTSANAGRLESINDRDGNVLDFSHDTSNRITGATDAAGRAYTITRDSSGRITRVKDFTQRYVEYTWNSDNMITKVRNPKGNNVTYGYTGTKLTSIDDPLHRQFSIAYDSSNRVSTVTDGLNYTWIYIYTSSAASTQATVIQRPSTNGVNNNLGFILDSARTKVLQRLDAVDAKIAASSFRSAQDRTRIQEQSLVESRQQSIGAPTNINYYEDGKGNPKDIIQDGTGTSVDLKTSMTWGVVNGQHNLTPMTSLTQPGATSASRYSVFTNSGKATNIYDPLNNRTQRQYNLNGLLTKTIDPRTNSTSMVYNPDGTLKQITDAKNNVTSYTYDSLGRVKTETNPRNRVTTYTYDGNGNTTQIDVQANGVTYTTKHTYDAADNLVSTIDPRQNTISYEYDALNRKKVERYTVGGQTYTRSFVYDAMGRVYKTIDEKNRTSETRFDVRGRAVQQINAMPETTTYEYDANGNVTKVTDAEGRSTTKEYDEFNRLTKITDPLGYFVAYTYNSQGLMATKRDARGLITSYKYDDNGQMTEVIDPENGSNKSTKATYDANGNLFETVDPKGQKTTFTYDELNRMTKLTDNLGRHWDFEYDTVGNLIKKTTPAGQVTTYTYDGFDRVTRVVYPGGPTVGYTYDANGNRLTMTDTNGTTSYTYDELNRLTAVTDAFGNTVGYKYDATGQLQQLTYPGNKVASYEYDAADRLHYLRDWLNHTTKYTRDRTGLVKEILYGNGAKVIKNYDVAGRLTSLVNRNAASAVISSHGLDLDGLGNPIKAILDLPLLPTNLGRSAEMLYDASNRLTSIAGVAITSDTDGRITNDPSGTAAIQYAYNAQDLITTVTKAGVLTDTYIYDGDGRRIARTQSNQTTRYVLDATGGDLYSVLAETNASNVVQHYYLYGEGLVAQVTGNGHLYYHFDQTGNTIALTNDSGVVTDSYAYEPFGNTTVQGSSYNPFRFVGKYGVMDDSNGLQHMRARYYRPDLRRFLSLDALYGNVDDPQTLNRYAYVIGNPIVGVDPSGKCSGSTGEGSCLPEKSLNVNDLYGLNANSFKLHSIKDEITLLIDIPVGLAEKFKGAKKIKAVVKGTGKVLEKFATVVNVILTTDKITNECLGFQSENCMAVVLGEGGSIAGGYYGTLLCVAVGSASLPGVGGVVSTALCSYVGGKIGEITGVSVYHANTNVLAIFHEASRQLNNFENSARYNPEGFIRWWNNYVGGGF
ncbi:hypothetical protein TI04_04635 [Achromatium sp. WMS2]|nr:hypothetical protein TI04_04635 [Achromatium sp. WMS2]